MNALTSIRPSNSLSFNYRHSNSNLKPNTQEHHPLTSTSIILTVDDSTVVHNGCELIKGKIDHETKEDT